MAMTIARISTLAALSIGLSALTSADAQQLPRSFVASPDIYQVIAQNEQYTVIAATWKPGQKDVLHSHPAYAVYFLTDCNLRIHAPDGSFSGAPRRAGMAFIQAPAPGHVIENIGTADCQLVMFEPS